MDFIFPFAVKYTPAGGRIDLATATAPGKALAMVRDTGIGIEPGEHERIWVRLPGR